MWRGFKYYKFLFQIEMSEQKQVRGNVGWFIGEWENRESVLEQKQSARGLGPRLQPVIIIRRKTEGRERRREGEMIETYMAHKPEAHSPSDSLLKTFANLCLRRENTLSGVSLLVFLVSTFYVVRQVSNLKWKIEQKSRVPPDAPSAPPHIHSLSHY